nr:MAG TPA: hypothetical protein [Myoviridae sp. ctNqw6]
MCSGSIRYQPQEGIIERFPKDNRPGWILLYHASDSESYPCRNKLFSEPLLKGLAGNKGN